MNAFEEMSAVTQLVVVILIASLAVGLYVYCLYLRTLSRALRACSARNRAIAPGRVWLTLIPVFGLAYQFRVVLGVARSLKAEFRSRRGDDTQDFGRAAGLTMAANACAYAALSWVGMLAVPVPPVAGLAVSLIVLAAWITHWVQIAGCGNTLRAINRYARHGRLATA